MNSVFLGVGTNLGDRENNLKEAIARIAELAGPILKSSSIFETEPWGFEAKDEFLNNVVMVHTELSPHDLLDTVLKIETSLGRVRGNTHYSSRVIDIDILFYNDSVINDENLKIPHPLLQNRRFVLVPLCEIAPLFIHPVLKKTISELLEICDDRSRVIKYL